MYKEYSITTYICYKRPINITKTLATILQLDSDLERIKETTNKCIMAYNPEKSQNLILLHFIKSSKYRLIIRIPEYLKSDITNITQLQFEESSYITENTYDITELKCLDFSKGSKNIIILPTDSYINMCYNLYEKYQNLYNYNVKE